jgi:hypothetical protein
MNEIYIDEGKNQSSSLSDYNNNEGAEQEYKRQIFAPAL